VSGDEYSETAAAMLTIRKEQNDALRQIPHKVFENSMLAHVRKYFPEDCKILGEAHTRKVITFGITRAESYGFNTAGETCRYISLMFMFGSRFDEDPQLPWAMQVLQDKAISTPWARMNHLYDKALDFLERVAGANGEYYKRSLLKIRSQSFETFTKAGAGNLAQNLRSFLAGLYPQKYHELDAARIENLIELAQSSAGKAGLVTQQGIFVYAGLMFLLGSHFDSDPLYPWAAAVLEDGSINDPVLKGHRLFEKAMYRLEQYLAITKIMESA
jgi:hypothetical protein